MSTRTIPAMARTAPFERDVDAALVRHLYRQGIVGVVGTFLGGCLLTYVLWNAADQDSLRYWLLALACVCAGRLVQIRAYFRRAPPPASAMRWARAAAAGTLASGVTWGLACILFFDPAEPLSVITLTVILLAVAGGSAASYGSYLPSFWAFNALALGALMGVALWHGGLVNNMVAFIAVVAAVGYFLAARNVRHLNAESLRLGFENVALIADLKRREAALDAARRDAEQANAAKTRFLAAASHDLRQPIHALGLLLATLADRARSERTAPLLEQIDASVHAVDAMLESLLDISKLDAGVVRPQIGPVDVRDLLLRLASEQQQIAELTGNALRVRAAALFAMSDAAMLHRILANLVANALRYTVSGRVLVGTRRRGGSIRIDVCDTGPGIPAESLDDIFLEFHQLGNPERDRRHGLGLGLAIVKRLAGLLGHPIEVRSVVGRGSRFSITLPRTAEVPRVRLRGAAVTLADDGLRGRRVLVLDDELSVLDAMRPLLEDWGCEVITTATPEEAEARVASAPALPDLLIVDYRLRRNASGIEVIGRLRRLTGAPIPALIVTGDTAPDRLREAQASGYMLLHKPVMAGQLRAAMRQLMEHAGVERG